MSSLRAGATQSSWWLAKGGWLGRDVAGINWIASPSLAMTGGDSFVRDDGEGVVIASGSDAIQLVVGEGWLAWERRGGC